MLCAVINGSGFIFIFVTVNLDQVPFLEVIGKKSPPIVFFLAKVCQCVRPQFFKKMIQTVQVKVAKENQALAWRKR